MRGCVRCLAQSFEPRQLVRQPVARQHDPALGQLASGGGVISGQRGQHRLFVITAGQRAFQVDRVNGELTAFQRPAAYVLRGGEFRQGGAGVGFFRARPRVRSARAVSGHGDAETVPVPVQLHRRAADVDEKHAAVVVAFGLGMVRVDARRAVERLHHVADRDARSNSGKPRALRLTSRGPSQWFRPAPWP